MMYWTKYNEDLANDNNGNMTNLSKKLTPKK